MYLLPVKEKPSKKQNALIVLAFLIAIPFASLALGSPDLIVGINEQPNAYTITDVLTGPSEVTIFASEDVSHGADVILAIIGDNAIGTLVNGQPFQQGQVESEVALTDGYTTPYYLWNLGNIQVADDRRAAALLDRAHRLLLDGRQAADHVVAGRLRAANVFAAGERAFFHVIDAVQDQLGNFR